MIGYFGGSRETEELVIKKVRGDRSNDVRKPHYSGGIECPKTLFISVLTRIFRNNYIYECLHS